MLRGYGPHKPEYAYDIVRTHSLIINMHLAEYSTVGDTKAALLRFYPFISKERAGDFITTGPYMNNQTFCKLQFRRLLKGILFIVFTLT